MAQGVPVGVGDRRGVEKILEDEEMKENNDWSIQHGSTWVLKLLRTVGRLGFKIRSSGHIFTS